MASGMEMMLRSMGLGDIITAAQTFITNGTLQKIVSFADGLEALNAERERDRQLLYCIAGKLGITPDTDPGLFDNRSEQLQPIIERLAVSGTVVGRDSNSAPCHDDDASHEMAHRTG